MKSVFITGANRGLGYGFAEYLSKNGFLVFAGTRKITDTLPVLNNVVWVECDVRSDDSIDTAVGVVKANTDSLTLLINNAGVNKDTIPEGDKNLVSKMGSLDRNALMGMFDSNAVSPMMVTQKFLPLLSAHPSFVINISSARASFNNGHAGSTANYGYAASKIALNMLTYCSEAELPENVRTFAVNPGGVKTDMNPDGPGEPLVIAEKIIAITENWREELNGKFLKYDGTLYPL